MACNARSGLSLRMSWPNKNNKSVNGSIVTSAMSPFDPGKIFRSLWQCFSSLVAIHSPFLFKSWHARNFGKTDPVNFLMISWFKGRTISRASARGATVCCGNRRASHPHSSGFVNASAKNKTGYWLHVYYSSSTNLGIAGGRRLSVDGQATAILMLDRQAAGDFAAQARFCFMLTSICRGEVSSAPLFFCHLVQQPISGGHLRPH